jgi:hypothetical protein
MEDRKEENDDEIPYSVNKQSKLSFTIGNCIFLIYYRIFN